MFLVGIFKLKQKSRRRKGRGFKVETECEEEKNIEDGYDEKDEKNPGPQPQRCNFIKKKKKSKVLFMLIYYAFKILFLAVEGWILIISCLHEEIQEEDLYNPLADFGKIINLHLNLDRRTGFAKVIVNYLIYSLSIF